MDKGSSFLLKEWEGHYALAASDARKQCNWSKPTPVHQRDTLGSCPHYQNQRGSFSFSAVSHCSVISCVILVDVIGRFISYFILVREGADPSTAAESSALPIQGEIAACAELSAAAAASFQSTNQANKVGLGMSAKAEVKTLTEGSHT